MALDLNQCDQACTGCVKGYIKKHALETGQTFEVECDGIPKDFIPLDLLASIPTSDHETALSVLDPVTWAANTLDWHCLDPDGSVWERKNPKEYDEWMEKNPGQSILGHSRYHRPYQALMLRCSSRRKVFRIGRQAGKCLPSGTLIQMADGTQKPVEFVNDGDLVASVDSDYRTLTNPAFRACNGEKEVLKIELMDGREIEATYNHPFLSRKNVGRETTGTRRAIFHDEWVDAGDLTEDNHIAVPRRIKLDLNEGVSNYYMTILGCMIADGNITDGNCRFSNGNKEILDHLENAISYLGCSLKQYETDQSEYDYHIVGQGIGKKHQVKDWFRKLGLQGLDSHQKYIPDFFMSLDDENTIELLRCMFGCDGWASVDKNGSAEIGYSTVSEKLANQVVALLARFGVYTTINHKTVKLNDKKFHSRQLVITRKESIANFRNQIGILGKEEAIETVYKYSQTKKSSPKTEAYEDNDIVFIKIRSIKHVGTKMTWDLTVPETHNFIANNIVTHNTECLVISMLYNMFVKPHLPENEGFKIVVITPYQAQIDLIFERLLQLISSSPVTQNSLKRHVKAPIYTLQLHNQSAVRGFTAGTKSGGNAESVRGQHGHMLVFDEADYLSSGDLDAALSIITNFPTATVWMSSTPSGKREKFYETCVGKDFKEYYYPSQVNPMWNASLEKLFRTQLTEIAYKHEILAEFGEQEEGVFQNVYVQSAKQKYQYGDFEVYNTWTYTMGVDWNDTKNGTTINVLGFNPTNNKFIVVDRTVVSREGWTQTDACIKIAEMNRIWKPISIYVDRGFGGGQYEILRKYGYDSMINPTKGPNHPDARLKDIVVQYDFGSKVETRDLFTKAPIQKEAKPFLVESTVRRFESGDIWFSSYDEALEKQLLGYVIDRITPTGRPVYKAIEASTGDHALDALMLSVAAFVLETTPWGKPKYDTNISFSGYFGEGKTIIHEGDTVVENKDDRSRYKEQRGRTRPSAGRDQSVSGQLSLFNHNELPANHIQQESRVGVWNYPGFSRDEPKPRVRSLSEAAGDAGKRMGLSPRRGGKPRRKTNW